MTRGLLLLLGIGVVACAERPPRFEIEVPGAVMSIDEHPVDRGRVLDDRISYELGDGLRLNVQWMPAEDRESGGRTPRSVAAAIAERIELGEREGDIAHHSCRAGQLEAECLTGWMVSGEARFARSGFTVRAGPSIVWLDVSGPQERQSAVTERAASIRSSLATRVDGDATP